MLNYDDFKIDFSQGNDSLDDVWIVRLDGVIMGTFATEKLANDFIKYLLSLELQRVAYVKHAKALLEEFEKTAPKKKSSHSPSIT